MRLIFRIIITIGANLLAIVLAARFLEGFTISQTTESFLTVALLLTLVNIFLRPVLKFFLAPIIFITLGFFTIVLNISLLLLVDKFSEELTIRGFSTLILATILISLINSIIHAFTRSLTKK